MTIAFIQGIVIVGDGRILERCTVLVDGERIVKVTRGDFHIPKEAHKISLSGRTLLPGFIDCHVHLCLDYSADPFASVIHEPLPTTTLKAAQFARQTLMGGVTTVRDVGGRDGIELRIRDAIQSGLIQGPRIFASERFITITGGQCWQLGREADGVHEVLKAGREQLKNGADVAKFLATGGILTAGVDPASEQFTEEELRAGIYEAHKAGKKTAAHAHGTRGMLNALRAGIDSIEHGTFLNEEAISWMVKRKIPLVPTLSARYNMESKGVAAGIPSFQMNKLLQTKPYKEKSIHMARDAGVLIAMGTDAGAPFTEHGMNLGELQHLVEVGYSPIDAIESGTRISAQVLGLEKELGTIEEGKLADLIIVEGNPLEDIGVLLRTESIYMIMLGGKVIKRQD